MLRLKHKIIPLVLCVFACGFVSAPLIAKAEYTDNAAAFQPGDKRVEAKAEESLTAKFDPQLCDYRYFFIAIQEEVGGINVFTLQQKYSFKRFRPEVHREIGRSAAALTDGVRTILSGDDLDHPVEDFVAKTNIEDLHEQVDRSTEMTLALGRFVLKTFNGSPDRVGVARTVQQQITKCDEMKIIDPEGRTLIRIECAKIPVNEEVKLPVYNAVAAFVAGLNDIVPQDA